MKKYIIMSLIITVLSIHSAYGYSVEYNHKNIEYTPIGLNIYGIPGSEYAQKGYEKQLEEFKSSVNGENVKYKLGDPKDFTGSKNNDYFYGFNHYRKNNIIGGKGDDLYSVQHTYNIIEGDDEGVDTYIFGGNSGPGYKNIENLISAGAGGRIYGGDNDNLLITEGIGSDVHGDGGNDIFIVNGLKNSYFGDDGIDTAVFPGSLNEYIIYGDSWSVTVENIKNGGKYHLLHHSTEQLQFSDAFFGYEAGINTLKVGPNETFKRVEDALHVAGDGDIIEIESGVYENDFAIINRDVTIKGVNGKAHFVATKASFKGKANFITSNANVTFDNVEFSGNKVSDRNGAGIRFEGGILTVKNSYFHNNQVAILGGRFLEGEMYIENTEFGFNGHYMSNPHTLNLGIMKKLHIKNSYFHNTVNAHNIRTGANELIIEDSFFYDGVSNTSFNIENYSSDTSVIKNNTFIQSEFGENHYIMMERAKKSAIITGNTFVNNSNFGVNAVYNDAKGSITINDNKLYNYKGFISGGVTGNNNVVLDSVNIDIPESFEIVGDVVYNNDDLIKNIKKDHVEFTKPATIDNFEGNIITVGDNGMYNTLNKAIINAKNGDQIHVAAGTYNSDYATVSNKNIAIIGKGEVILKKVASISNGKAILVSYKSNLLVDNITFMNAEVPDKNGAGIRYEGGTLTVRNSTFIKNENGILGGSTPEGKGNIWIYNSEFKDNGSLVNGGYTHAIYIGEMENFIIQDSIVSGTYVGHHVKSRARNSIIQNNRLDDDGKNASYNIDLPNGGNALVKGNIIIQSEKSANRTMLSYSAEKNPTNPGTLTVENNEFISEGNNSTGIYNFKNNPVILKNNTFKNVKKEYVGENITVITNSTPIINNSGSEDDIKISVIKEKPPVTKDSNAPSSSGREPVTSKKETTTHVTKNYKVTATVTSPNESKDEIIAKPAINKVETKEIKKEPKEVVKIKESIKMVKLSSEEKLINKKISLKRSIITKHKLKNIRNGDKYIQFVDKYVEKLEQDSKRLAIIKNRLEKIESRNKITNPKTIVILGYLKSKIDLAESK